ncbi:Auxin-induced protein [Macleaya cordata]|uniref:Auxin-induced protein n=1 Tax=Macleaya cordata TaxID=56857 RepID=A0A200R074_MACCD|nr:Auxin-induced protein [Macleaya cordata]
MTLQNIRFRKALKKLHLNNKSTTTLPITTTKSLSSPPKINYSNNILADDDFCCCDQHHDSCKVVEEHDHQYCCCEDDDVPADVQKGFFAVYVVDGEDEEEEYSSIDIKMRRYVIPVSYLQHRVFAALLRRAEEEFGFSHNNKGGIRLPCETVLFDHLLWLLNRNDPSIHSLEVDELLNFYR